MALAVLVVGASWLAVANHVGIRSATTSFLIVDLLGAVSFGAVGLLIVAHRPRERLAWLLVLVAVGCALTAATAQYAWYGTVTRPGALPSVTAAAWLASWSWVVGYAAFLVGVPLLFPTGRLPDCRWRPVAALAAFATVLLIVGAAFAPGVNHDMPGVANPYAASGASGSALTWVAHVGTLLLLATVIAGLASVRSRWRAATGRERAQLRWMVVAAAALVVGEALSTVTMIVMTGTVDTTVEAVAETALVPLVAVAVGLAVWRHRLYDIDVWLNRALVYGVLSVAVLGCYAGVVGYFAAALHIHGRGPALVATAVVAVAFHRVRDWVQRGISRLLYGRRDEPYVVLTTLARRLHAAPAADALAVVADTVRQALRLPYAEAALTGAAPVAAGTPAPIVARVPLTFGQEVVGELRVSGRLPGEPLTLADERVLTDYASQAGIAASASQLAAQLDLARHRLVAAREEERRRLARDLHDGLGPQLASYTLSLDAARALLETTPAKAADLLIDLRDQVQCAVDELRRIARDLRPAALDGQGLAAAITDHLTRMQTPTLDIALELPETLPPMSAATEVAAYRVITEAVTNTVRHANARRCQVRMTIDNPAALVVEVTDNGRGIPANAPRGVGHVSMRERVDELGGSLAIASDTGGTSITARLPLSVPA
ncbi:MAG TPA: sensor histidine kinase [Mycobacteriales bacterium]|nr:sensor histidine kinase [Mycobacteriales bacterium]